MIEISIEYKEQGEKNMKCINCGYFLNCTRAEENKTECERYIERRDKNGVYKFDDVTCGCSNTNHSNSLFN